MPRLADKVMFGYQCPLYPYETILDLALYCEEVGFDAVTMADHTVGIGLRTIDSLEAWTTLSALAARTRRVRLGTVVSDVYRHHPAVLAQMVSTLDHVSGGRAFLGVGLGEAMNLEPFHIPHDKPLTRTREALRLIKRLWSAPEGRVEFEGTYYRASKGFITKPRQAPHPPIWVAGNSKASLSLTAELGDGWVPWTPNSPDLYREDYEMLRTKASDLGRNPDNITPALFTYLIVAESRDEARRLVDFPGRLFALLCAKSLTRMGVEVPGGFGMDTFQFSDPKALDALKEKIEAVPSEVVERAGYIYGTPEDCVEKIQAYAEAGVRFFIIAPFVPLKLMKPTLQLFAEKVLPHFTG